MSPSSTVENTRSDRTFRAMTVVFAKILLAVGLLYWAIAGEQLQFEQIFQASHRPIWLGLAVFCFTLQLWLGAWRLHLLFETTGHAHRFWEILKFNYLGAFFDVFLVTAVGGDAIKGFYLAQARPAGKRLEVLSLLLLDRLMGLAGMLSLGGLVAVLYFVLIDANIDRSWPLRFAWTLLVLLMALLLVGVLLFSRRIFQAPKMQCLLDKLPLGSQLKTLYAALQQVRTFPKILGATYLLSVATHMVGLGTGYCLLHSLLLESSILTFALAWPMGQLSTAIAAFGGIGVGQVTWEAIFQVVSGFYGGANLATLYQLCVMLCKLPGAPVWILLRKKERSPLHSRN